MISDKKGNNEPNQLNKGAAHFQLLWRLNPQIIQIALATANNCFPNREMLRKIFLHWFEKRFKNNIGEKPFVSVKGIGLLSNCRRIQLFWKKIWTFSLKNESVEMKGKKCGHLFLRFISLSTSADLTMARFQPVPFGLTRRTSISKKSKLFAGWKDLLIILKQSAMFVWARVVPLRASNPFSKISPKPPFPFCDVLAEFASDSRRVVARCDLRVGNLRHHHP